MSRYPSEPPPKGWVWFTYTRSPNSILMDLLNVKYEILHSKRLVLLRKSYLPRAFIVPECKFVAKDDIFDHILKPDFDPTKIIFVEEKGLCSHFKVKKDRIGIVKIVNYGPDHITLKINSLSDGYLFLSEIYYPGWKAYIDNRAVPIFRANYIFRAIFLPKGEHMVYLQFDPISIKIGMAISILALFIILEILIYKIWYKKVS